MEHAQETGGPLIVARDQGAKLLEPAEKALDFVTLAVPVAVKAALRQVVFLLGMTTAAPITAPRVTTLLVS